MRSRPKELAGLPLCFVYFNLHKKVWSVKDVATQRVVAHLHTLAMFNAMPKVSEAGRQRVIRERKKYVHAGFEGYVDLSDPDMYGDLVYGRAVTYNPYKHEGFVYRDTENYLDKEAQYTVAFLSDRNVICSKHNMENML